jgi:hypothetical protein
MARGGQIRGVHQRHRVRLHSLPPQQPPDQMPVDGAQCTHAQGLPKLVEHPGGGQRASQPGEAPPGGLLGQLCHEEVERMGRGQDRQQMRAPQLRRAQGMTPAAGEVAPANPGDELVGDVGTQQFEQAVGADRRQRQTHARTLTRTSAHDTPPVSA